MGRLLPPTTLYERRRDSVRDRPQPRGRGFGKVYWANWNGGIMSANLDGSGASQLFPTSGERLRRRGRSHGGHDLLGQLQSATKSGAAIWTAQVPRFCTTDPAEAPRAASRSTLRITRCTGRTSSLTRFVSEIWTARVGSVRHDSCPGSRGQPDRGRGLLRAGKIYWTNLNSGQVRSGNVDGSGATTLFTSPQASGPSIDPVAGKIYWTSWSPGGLDSGWEPGRLARCPTLFSGESASLFTAILKAPALSRARGPRGSGGAKTEKVHTCEGGENVSWASDVVGAFFYRAPTSVIYQWRRNGGDIATGQTFTPTQAGDYTCAVKATNEAGSTSQTSSVKKIKVK